VNANSYEQYREYSNSVILEYLSGAITVYHKNAESDWKQVLGKELPFEQRIVYFHIINSQALMNLNVLGITHVYYDLRAQIDRKAVLDSIAHMTACCKNNVGLLDCIMHSASVLMEFYDTNIRQYDLGNFLHRPLSKPIANILDTFSRCYSRLVGSLPEQLDVNVYNRSILRTILVFTAIKDSFFTCEPSDDPSGEQWSESAIWTDRLMEFINSMDWDYRALSTWSDIPLEVAKADAILGDYMTGTESEHYQKDHQ
jgi:hypothetical protein